MRRRMLGRTSGGSDFRYLHDEISGGVIACSHLKCKSDYTGDCVILDEGSGGELALGFINNIVESYDATQQQTVKWCNQLNSLTSLGSAGAINKGYDPALDDFSTINLELIPSTKVLDDFQNTSDSFTTIHVIENFSGAGRYLGLFGSQAPGRDSLFYRGMNTEDLRLWSRTGINNRTVEIYWNGGWLWGLGTTKIICCTYDGSRIQEGFEVYRNDMINPLAKVVSRDQELADVAWGQNITGNWNLGNNSQSPNQALFKEAHFFPRVLSQSERETAKEILEQYYTFS